MKPELVTIQKTRLYQLGGAALFAMILSFYAGYCSRGPGDVEKLAQQQTETADKAAKETGMIVSKLEPLEVKETSPAPAEPETAAPMAMQHAAPGVTPEVENISEPSPPVKSATPPAKEPPAPKKPAEAPKPQPEKKAEVKQPEPPKTPAEPKESKPSSGGTKYTIQAAAFKNKTDADKMVESLTQKNYPAYTRNATIKGEQWHRVRIGSYSTVEEAKKVAARLEAEKRLKAMVVKYD